MKKVFKKSVVLFAVMIVCGTAYAQFMKPDEATGYRKGAMKIVGHHFGVLAGILKAEKDFDKTAFARNAAIVASISDLPMESTLITGSDQDSGLKPAALGEKDGFQKHLDTMRAATKKLSADTAGGDVNTIKGQFGRVVESCKGCHGAYRR